MHDSTKVLMGQSLQSGKEISRFDSDPASFPAGVCVSLGSDGGLSLLKSAGMRVGVSMGRSLSDHKKTSVLRAGDGVPVLAHLKRSTGTITITNIANLVDGTDDTITIGGTAFTATDGDVTPGQATFDARTGTTEAAASLAAQINAHATASTKVYAVASAAIVTLYAVVEGAGTGHDVTTTYEQLGSGVGATVAQAALSGGSNTISDIAYVTIGAKMYINDTTGKADINISGFTTVSDATYQQLELTGINEDSSLVAAVIVDMPGGL
jgi:hypothetical protein